MELEESCGDHSTRAELQTIFILEPINDLTIGIEHDQLWTGIAIVLYCDLDLG